MAKRRTDRKLGTFTVKEFSATVEFFLTPDDEFSAQVGSTRFVAGNKGALEADVYKHLKLTNDVEWIPVLLAILPRDSSRTLSIDRLYLGEVAGVWREVSFDTLPESRGRNSREGWRFKKLGVDGKFYGVYAERPGYGESSFIVLPYSEDLFMKVINQKEERALIDREFYNLERDSGTLPGVDGSDLQPIMSQILQHVMLTDQVNELYRAWLATPFGDVPTASTKDTPKGGSREMEIKHGSAHLNQE